MSQIGINAFRLLEKIRKQKPVIHHLTNWVTIYDCAQVVKTLGGSPVMAHALEEMEDMAGIASALVLNIGTLTVDFVEAMKKALMVTNARGIPVVLDVCGAGATKLRDDKCFDILDTGTISVIKGNASEIARISGLSVQTKGVDAGSVNADARATAVSLAQARRCTVAMTGETDIVTDGKRVYCIKNGHSMMANVVGTGCMAASVIGTFAAVDEDVTVAAVAALVCFEIASEHAVQRSAGPGTFTAKMLDALYDLTQDDVIKGQKVTT